VELASDRARLAELRSTLRRRMLASPLLDVEGYARSAERAYRAMWRDACAA
jgi:protein O-GlcNAc transferase